MSLRINLILSTLGLVLCAMGQLDGSQLAKKSAVNSGIYLHFSLEKTEFLTAEPIFLTILVENQSADTQRYMFHGLWRENIRLRNSTGRNVPPSRWGFPLPYEDPTTIAPLESSGGDCRNLLEYYGEGQRGGFLYLPAGEYVLSASAYTSDTIRFAVKDPTGDEDKEAFERVKWGSDYGLEIIASHQLMVDTYMPIVELYPNSNYVPLALYALIMTGTNDSYFTSAVQQRYVRMMISEYPTFGSSYRALYALDASMVPENEQERVSKGLQDIKSHYSSPSIKRFVDELVTKISE